MILNIEDLRSDVHTYMVTKAHAMCKTAKEELTKVARDAIDYFYNDYSPIYYDRSNEMHDKTIYPYMKNNGSVYYGGVKINDSAVSGGTYHLPVGEVFSNVWEYGFHGVGKNGAILTSPTPYNMVFRKYISGFLMDTIESVGEEAARSQSYNILRFE